jgi:branched-chain amino acid transport system substrate-binding protein
MEILIMRKLTNLIFWLIILWCGAPMAGQPEPVYIGLDAEFGYQGSTSAEAIEGGMRIAIEEINKAGGVLNGRPLALLKRANHSVPARSVTNIEELASIPDVAAVFCGRFSPTVLDSLDTIHKLQIPMLDPWAAADAIVDNGYKPNYVFRLSLRDSWAMQVMIPYAGSKNARNIGLLLLNTSWGRSNLKAAEAYIQQHPQYRLAATHWYNWSDDSLLEKYMALYQAGAQAVIIAGNAEDAIKLLQAETSLPKSQRLPIISHWGVTGGDFVNMAGPMLQQVDFSVVQTYSFIGKQDASAQRVLTAAKRLFNVADARQLASPVGVAHAYDLTHILAKAINKAGSLDRVKIRNALEQVKDYAGLIKTYKQPFTAERHDALTLNDVFMAKYAADGAIEPVIQAGKRR